MSRPPIPAWSAVLHAAAAGTFALALPTPAGPARRLARHLLDEAAAQAGGAAVETPGGLLLLGIPAGMAMRTAAAVAELIGTSPPEPLPLPDAAATLEAWAAARPAEATPLGARLTLLMDAEGMPRAQFLAPATSEAGHAAREAACRRLLADLADPARRLALPRLRPGLRLFLACPVEAPAGPDRAATADGPAAPVAVLPLAALWPAGDFPAHAAAWRAAGWQAGMSGTDPSALDWMPETAWRLAPPGDAPPAWSGPRLVLLGPRPAWAPPDALHAA